MGSCASKYRNIQVRMKKVLPIAAILIAITMFIWTSNLDKQSSLSSGVPDLALEGHEEEIITLRNLDGPLVINSWASWCTFCKQELIDFKNLQEKFDDSVTIIAINRAESKEKSKEYTAQLGVEGSLLFLSDPDDSFYKSIDGFTMPETIFIDSSGELVSHKRGVMSFNEIEEKINQLVST